MQTPALAKTILQKQDSLVSIYLARFVAYLLLVHAHPTDSSFSQVVTPFQPSEQSFWPPISPASVDNGSRETEGGGQRCCVYHLPCSFVLCTWVTLECPNLLTPLGQIYTDTITFTPLSSSFSSSNDAPSSTSPMTNLPSATPSEVQNNAAVNKSISPKADLACTRPEWITHWQVNNPGRPVPCSAKAVYRLTDSQLDSISPLDTN